MSDSDDSDDSGLPFDVEIEKCEKRLQLARYKKKYRNEWDYITNRWQEKHIHIVLKDIEQKWRVYSAGSHEQIHFQNISEAFRYLEDVFEDRYQGIETILEKSLFYKKPKSLFRTRTKYVASGLAIMVRKGLVGFTRYGFWVILGRKGLGAAISPTGVVFLEGGGRQTCALPKRPPPTLSKSASESG